MRVLFPDYADHIEPGSYAIIGAAALSTGVTRTISTVVIVIELTKQINLLLPILVFNLMSLTIDYSLNCNCSWKYVQHFSLYCINQA